MTFRGFVVLAALAGMGSPALAGYTLTELTVVTRTPFNSIVPTGITEAGAVIGIGNIAYLQSTALIWTAAGVGRTMAPPDSICSTANAINATGKVVGTADFMVAGNRVSQAFVYDSISDSFSFPVGPGSSGNDINDAGQIVGELNGQPFLYDPGTGVRTYALPPGIVSASFNGISNDGTIIGIRSAVTPLGPQLSSTSFVLADADGAVPDWPMNPTFATTYLTSNNAGQYSIQSAVVNAPFFSSSSGIYNLDDSFAANQLGKLPGDDFNYGGGFNDFLDIVGESYNENRYGGGYGDAIITTRDGVTSLLAPQVTNLGSYFLQQGRVINNAGMIGAFGRGKAFLLRPDSAPPPPGVPEPANWALLIAGFGLTGAVMRRRRQMVSLGS